MTQEKLDKIAKRYAQDELKDNHGQVEDVVAAGMSAPKYNNLATYKEYLRSQQQFLQRL